MSQANNSRREARKAHRAANQVKADTQDVILSEKSKEPVKPVVRAPAKPRKEQIAEQRAAVEAKVEEQDHVVAVPVTVDLSRYRGVNPPLNVLNAMSREAGKRVRNEAREVAGAAGKAAFNMLIGRKQQASSSKHGRLNEALNVAEAQRRAAEAAAGTKTD